jgi:hypothetical protein
LLHNPIEGRRSTFLGEYIHVVNPKNHSDGGEMGDVGSIGIPWPLKVREFSHEKWWIFPVRYANVYQRVSPSFPNFGMYRDIMGRSCGKPKKKHLP